MNWFRALTVLILLGAVLATGIHYFLTQDKREILKNWNSLLEAVEKSEPGNRVVNLARANRVPDFFADPFLLDTTPHGPVLTDREELRSQALALAEYASSVVFDYEKVELLFNRSQALMVLRGSAIVTYDHRRIQFEDEARVTWNRTDDGWRISYLTLEKNNS